MRISDWSSDVCSSDLVAVHRVAAPHHRMPLAQHRADEPWQRRLDLVVAVARDQRHPAGHPRRIERVEHPEQRIGLEARPALDPDRIADPAQEFDMRRARSEEHTSELQSLMRISYALSCLNNKKQTNTH